jgi:hypothetical protein
MLLPSSQTSSIAASLRVKTDPSAISYVRVDLLKSTPFFFVQLNFDFLDGQGAAFTVVYYNSQLSLSLAPTQGPAEGGGTVLLQVDQTTTI